MRWHVASGPILQRLATALPDVRKCPVRLAHFSDIHYTLAPWSNVKESARGKRIIGLLSYSIGGRGRRFGGSPARIAALLDDVDAQGVDHAICTGDLTQVSRSDEFKGIAALFGERLHMPERFTVIPGNHDRYLHHVVQEKLYENEFASLCPGVQSGFPFSKRAHGVRIIGLDPCRPTGINARGECGAAQRQALDAMLKEDLSVPTIVALHYGLIRHDGSLDTANHGMIDAEAVTAILDTSPANIILVAHGHLHHPFTVATKRRTIVCAGSGTDLHLECGYFIYDVDLATGSLQASRRRWNEGAQRFEEADARAFNAAIAEHRGMLFPA
jgi:3',5'-cyclic AMP phosphodiesterase CpdA